MDDGEPKVRCPEAVGRDVQGAEMDGAAPRHGDAYLAHPSTWEEQRRYPLPPELAR